ncbi:MAG TPA: phospholipid carrier-dependent glycosyltransferase, partial [Anaerolineae bacterium]
MAEEPETGKNLTLPAGVADQGIATRSSVPDVTDEADQAYLELGSTPWPAPEAAARYKRRALALSLGLFLFAIYLLSYRGGFHSIDEVSMFATTESLVKFGRFNTDQIAWTQWTTSQAEAQGFFGRDGHVYSKKGLGLSLAQAPLYWLALLLPGLGMLQTVSVLNAIITAASGLLLFIFVRRLHFSTATALITALIYGLATIAFIYAKYLFSEPLAGLLLLLAAYMLLAYRQEAGLRHIVIAGLAAGASVLTRANNLFLLPVFGLYLLWVIYANPDMSPGSLTQSGSPGLTSGPPPASSRTPFWRFIHPFIAPVGVFILAVAVVGASLLAYNALRSGDPTQTGYDLTLFSPNVLLGLYKLLFSPLRGLFIYSPILLLSLPGWWLLRKTHTAEAWLCAGLAGITIGLFSAWSSGEGLSWGSRFLVPIIPFLTICLAPI